MHQIICPTAPLRCLLAAVMGVAIAFDAMAHEPQANAIPLGDGKISATPKVGYAWACRSPFNGGGARGDVPWIHGSFWDLTSKPTVLGTISWPQADFRMSEQGTMRVASGNGLPVGTTSGRFPISPSDPAYAFDTNPNALEAQDFHSELPLAPSFATSPSCLPMGPIGYALNGVALFNPLDAQGRDAVAHEVQDACNGHPERSGRYHYHGPSPCIAGSRSPGVVVGFALDGFPITSAVRFDGKAYSNEDLDACHGTTDKFMLDGRQVRGYHYAMTREFPYILGCFMGEPKLVSQGPGHALDPRPQGRAGPGNRNPPTEAIAACSGVLQGDRCGFSTPRGDFITGQCRPVGQGGVACVPDVPPRH